MVFKSCSVQLFPSFQYQVSPRLLQGKHTIRNSGLWCKKEEVTVKCRVSYIELVWIFKSFMEKVLFHKESPFMQLKFSCTKVSDVNVSVVVTLHHKSIAART